MKGKKHIEKLATLVPTVKFPREDVDFVRFRVNLRDLVIENFDKVEDFSYDPEDGDDGGTFSWQRREFVGVFKKSGVRMERTFRIDPKKPLVEEFTRVEAEIAAFAEDLRTMRRALVAAGGEI